MTSQDAVAAMIDALHAASAPYMLVGSLASNLYGIARSTNDADFVVQLKSTPIQDVVRQLGPQFRFDPQISFEGVTATRRHVVEVSEIAFKIELFALSDEPYDQLRFARRRTAPLLSRQVSVLSVEDVIVTKLLWSKEGRRVKDTEDVADVLSAYSGAIDWNYVQNWCSQHGTLEILDRLRARSSRPAN